MSQPVQGAPSELLSIHEYQGEGYHPLVDYQSWRVAILRYIDELLPENLTAMQRHNETDEVFVLLSGRCLLFLAEGEESLGQIHPVDMEPLKLYTVRRGCWHTHTLSQDATVLIVENQDTGDVNSPSIALTPPQREEIVALTAEVWSRL